MPQFEDKEIFLGFCCALLRCFSGVIHQSFLNFFSFNVTPCHASTLKKILIKKIASLSFMATSALCFPNVFFPLVLILFLQQCHFLYSLCYHLLPVYLRWLKKGCWNYDISLPPVHSECLQSHDWLRSHSNVKWGLGKEVIFAKWLNKHEWVSCNWLELERGWR